MTDLDYRLREIAMTDYSLFTKLVGERAIINAKICLLHADEKTIQQISNKLKVTYMQARFSCYKCPESKGVNEVKQLGNRKN